MDGNSIGDKGIQYLCESLENRSLNTHLLLNIGTNRIGDNGGQCLIKTLENNTINHFHLIINLNQNNMNEQIKRHLIRILRTSNNLTVLL